MAYAPMVKYSETTLWTNPAPASTSGFVSQTVTLSDSVQNYKFIKFEFCYNPYQTSKLGEVIVSIDDLIQTGTIDDIKIAMSLVAGSYIYTRIGRYMSDTTFFFNSCSQYNASIASISDAAVVPTRIIGIK